MRWTSVAGSRGWSVMRRRTLAPARHRLRLRLERLQVGQQPVGGDPLVGEADALAPALVDQQRVGAVLEVEAAAMARAAAEGAVAHGGIRILRRGRRRPVRERLGARIRAAARAGALLPGVLC